MSQNNQSVRLVSLICTFSLIYLPIFLLIAYYTDTIYKIGKYHSLSLLFFIGIMESIKFGLRLLSKDVNYESQSSKMKKYCMRLKMKEIFKCGYIFAAATAVIYVIAVLFGAPIIAEYEETLMFALFVSVLCILPSLLNLGADNTVAVITGAKLGGAMNSLVSDMITTNIHLTVLGAWLGAVVIPLDWERPWQVWPIPCCLGAISGCFLSYLFTLTKIMPSFAKVYSGINQGSKHSRSRNC